MDVINSYKIFGINISALKILVSEGSLGVERHGKLYIVIFTLFLKVQISLNMMWYRREPLKCGGITVTRYSDYKTERSMISHQKSEVAITNILKKIDQLNLLLYIYILLWWNDPNTIQFPRNHWYNPLTHVEQNHLYWWYPHYFHTWPHKIQPIDSHRQLISSHVISCFKMAAIGK